MAERNPQSVNHVDPAAQAAGQLDYFQILVPVIVEASRDPAQLRKLVYALAWCKTEALLADPDPDPVKKATTLLALEHGLELQQAIDRIEALAADDPQKLLNSQQEGKADPESSLPRNFGDLDELAAQPTTSQSSTDLAVMIPPARPPVWLSHQYGFLEEVSPRLDRFRAAQPFEFEPAKNPHWVRSGLLSFIQLSAAVVLGVALYVGITGWGQIGQLSMPRLTAAASLPPAPTKTAPAATNGSTTGIVRTSAPVAQPQTDTEPSSPLPFPLPTSYGIYAATSGNVVELEQLPIKIPTTRVQVSAEINKPSHATVPDGNVTFLVFRRDMMNSAPQTASVRVVARVSRAMKFVDGKPTYTQLAGLWRVRATSYDFKVSPLEGKPEMILIQPDKNLVLAPGRYALVLNGYGYDFTVAGKVTSPEQCLEQVEMLNGTVVSECPKS